MRRVELFLLSLLICTGCDEDAGPGRRFDASLSQPPDAALPTDDADVVSDADEPDAPEAPDASAPDAAEPDAGGPAAQVERGRYLVHHVAGCIDCHTPRKPDGSPDTARLLAGSPCFIDADPGDPQSGCLSSRNLTDHETGLRNRTAREIKDMFMKGERPDGAFLHPIMPYYVFANIADPDADAIVAYLRTVPGVDNMIPPNQPPFANLPAAAPSWPDALIPGPRPDYADQEAALRGRYLAGSVGVCMECHTPSDAQGRKQYDRAFQGGNAFPRALLGLGEPFPELILSSNLTPHATGLLGRTVEDIVRTLREAVDTNQDDSPLCPPMPAGPMSPLAGLTDGDVRDIAHYLLSLPPVENQIAIDCRPPAP